MPISNDTIARTTVLTAAQGGHQITVYYLTSGHPQRLRGYVVGIDSSDLLMVAVNDTGDDLDDPLLLILNRRNIAFLCFHSAATYSDEPAAVREMTDPLLAHYLSTVAA